MFTSRSICLVLLFLKPLQVYSSEGSETVVELLSRDFGERINNAYTSKLSILMREKPIHKKANELEQAQTAYSHLQNLLQNPEHSVDAREFKRAANLFKRLDREFDKKFARTEAELFLERKNIALLFYRIFSDLDLKKDFDLACKMLLEAIDLTIEADPDFCSKCMIELGEVYKEAQKFEEAHEAYSQAMVLFNKRGLNAKEAVCRQELLHIQLFFLKELDFTELALLFKDQAWFHWHRTEHLAAKDVQSHFFCSVLAFIFDSNFKEAKDHLVYLGSKSSPESMFLRSLMDLCCSNQKEELVQLARSYVCQEPLKREKEILLDCFEGFILDTNEPEEKLEPIEF